MGFGVAGAEWGLGVEAGAGCEWGLAAAAGRISRPSRFSHLLSPLPSDIHDRHIERPSAQVEHHHTLRLAVAAPAIPAPLKPLLGLLRPLRSPAARFEGVSQCGRLWLSQQRDALDSRQLACGQRGRTLGCAEVGGDAADGVGDGAAEEAGGEEEGERGS